MTMSRSTDKVTILHGYAMTPDKMWFPWLHAALERRGIGVAIPRMPDPLRPNYKKWMKAALPYARAWTPSTMVIAHSLGGVLSLRLLERVAKVRIGALVLVSPPFASTVNVKPLVEFFEKPIDWARVRDMSRGTVIIQAKDDPLVPPDHAARYAEALQAERILVPKGGHFTGRKFPLLEKVIAPLLPKM